MLPLGVDRGRLQEVLPRSGDLAELDVDFPRELNCGEGGGGEREGAGDGAEGGGGGAFGAEEVGGGGEEVLEGFRGGRGGGGGGGEGVGAGFGGGGGGGGVPAFGFVAGHWVENYGGGEAGLCV